MYLAAIALPAAAGVLRALPANGAAGGGALLVSAVLEGWGLLLLAAGLLWLGRGSGFWATYAGTLFWLAGGRVLVPLPLPPDSPGSFWLLYTANFVFCSLVVTLHWHWHATQAAAGEGTLPVRPQSPQQRRPRWDGRGVVTVAVLLASGGLAPLSYFHVGAVRSMLVEPAALVWRWCDLRSAGALWSRCDPRSQDEYRTVFEQESSGAFLVPAAASSFPLEHHLAAAGFMLGYAIEQTAYSRELGYDLQIPYWALAAAAGLALAARIIHRPDARRREVGIKSSLA